MGAVIGFLFAAFIYLLPTVIGWNKKNIAGLATLNLFLGWTIIGWVVALIWAMMDDKEVSVVISGSDKATQLEKLNNLRKDGALTEDEFQEQKKQILTKS